MISNYYYRTYNGGRSAGAHGYRDTNAMAGLNSGAAADLNSGAAAGYNGAGARGYRDTNAMTSLNSGAAADLNGGGADYNSWMRSMAAAGGASKAATGVGGAAKAATGCGVAAAAGGAGGGQEFDASDIVFAKVVRQGEEVMAVKLTGIQSVADVLRYVRSAVSIGAGRVIVKIRNYTQGWSLEHAFMLRAPRMPEGLQLTLF